MELKLSFPFEPLSQNNIERTGGRTNVRYKTDEAKVYKRQIEMQMRTTQWALIKEFKEFFNENIHGLEIELTWHLHHDKIFVKKMRNRNRRLSKTGLDWDNPIKFTCDVIFDYLDINDAFVTSAQIRKVPSLEPSYFDVKITIHELAHDDQYATFL